MKRAISRRMRFHAETAQAQEWNPAYCGKHENYASMIAEMTFAIDAEMMAEIEEMIDSMAEALELTEYFIAEVVEKSANRLRKIAEKIHLRMPTMKIPARKSMLEYICGRAVIPCVG